MKDYSEYEIKNYKYWVLQIHQNQGFLGRCIIWCKRENALDLSQATKEEQQELFIIINELKNALTKSFNPDWFNYAFLGNEARHLHGHVIPRYSREIEFGNQIFIDKDWGHNYKTDKNFVTSKYLLEAIKNKIKDNLE